MIIRWLTLGAATAAVLQVAMPITTLARGPLSGLDAPRQVVIRDAAAWTALWQEHAPNQPRPEVAFDTHTVLGVFLGTRPTTGVEVEITAARLVDETLTVDYVERRPGTGMLAGQMLTAPFHLVSVPRHTGPVRFDPRPQDPR